MEGVREGGREGGREGSSLVGTTDKAAVDVTVVAVDKSFTYGHRG